MVVAVNLGAEPVTLALPGTLILPSGPGVTHDGHRLTLPSSAAAWLAP